MDESAAMKKKLSREKQQSWNRGRSEVLGDDHQKGRIAIRAESQNFKDAVGSSGTNTSSSSEDER